MQSIFTKYLGATNSHGSRIRAITSGGAGSVSIPYDSGLNDEDNHDVAAKKLAEKLGWTGEMARGSGLKGTGNVYVFVKGGTISLPPGTRRG